MQSHPENSVGRNEIASEKGAQMVDIEIIHNETMGYYISIDVYGIFAESKWYKTKEKLAFAMATNTIKWDTTVRIEYDIDDADVDGAWA